METSNLVLARILRDQAVKLTELREYFLEDSGVADPMKLDREEFLNLCFRQELCGDGFHEQADAWQQYIKQSCYLLALVKDLQESAVADATNELKTADQALSAIYERCFGLLVF